MAGPIHIVLTFDDKFWAPAYATMRSVCMTTHRRRDLVFHLCHVGLSAAHRGELEAITTEYGATLKDYDLGQTDHLTGRSAQLPAMTAERYHVIVYARLFLADILPSDIDRVVFLDCDLFVRTAIEQLAEMDLQGNVIAAVLEPRRHGFQTYREMRPKRYFDTADPYFNAGVMLIDFQKWREIDFMAELEARLTPEEIKGLFQDQDILNVVMKDRWLVLDYRWNFQDAVVEHEPLDPLIAHYTGPRKPWLYTGRAAYKRLYRHIMTNRIFFMYLRERMRLRWVSRLRRLIGRK